MTASPVLVSYLKLPPDEQSFFRLGNILEIFKDKLEQLTFALAATQGPEKPDPLAPEIRTLLDPLIKLASKQCANAAVNVVSLVDFASRSLELVKASSMASPGQGVSDEVEEVIASAKDNARYWEEAEKEMRHFSEEIVSTVDKITAVLRRDDSRVVAMVFNDTNSQAVNDMVHAAQEGCALFRKTVEYLREAAEHFRDEKHQAQLPSQEEVAMMHQRWNGFIKGVKPLSDDVFTGIRAQINYGPDLNEARARADFWKQYGTEAPSTSTKKDTTSRQQVPKAIIDTNAQDAEVSSLSPQPRHKRSFFRSFFRCILSFLALRFRRSA